MDYRQGSSITQAMSWESSVPICGVLSLDLGFGSKKVQVRHHQLTNTMSVESSSKVGGFISLSYIAMADVLKS